MTNIKFIRNVQTITLANLDELKNYYNSCNCSKSESGMAFYTQRTRIKVKDKKGDVLFNLKFYPEKQGLYKEYSGNVPSIFSKKRLLNKEEVNSLIETRIKPVLENGGAVKLGHFDLWSNNNSYGLQEGLMISSRYNNFVLKYVNPILIDKILNKINE